MAARRARGPTARLGLHPGRGRRSAPPGRRGGRFARAGCPTRRWRRRLARRWRRSSGTCKPSRIARRRPCRGLTGSVIRRSRTVMSAAWFDHSDSRRTRAPVARAGHADHRQLLDRAVVRRDRVLDLPLQGARLQRRRTTRVRQGRSACTGAPTARLAPRCPATHRPSRSSDDAVPEPRAVVLRKPSCHPSRLLIGQAAS